MASPWLRLLSLWAAAAVLLAVVSGAGELGAAHDGLAALALAAAGGPRGRRVVPASAGASVRGGCARPLRRRGARHGARPPPGAGSGRAGRGARRRRARPPRALAAVRLGAGLHRAHEAADHVPPAPHRLLRPRGGRRRAAALGDHRRRDARPRSCLRRRERAQPRARQGHRPAHGAADAEAAGGGGPPLRLARARVRARPVGALLHGARGRRERPHGGARARRQPLLRPRLHRLAQAVDAAEHRHRRRGRSCPATRRLGGGHGLARAAGARPLPHRLPLDAAALLGARAAHQARLRGGGDSHAARRARRRRDGEADRPLLGRRSWRSPSSRSPPAGSAPCTSARRSFWAPRSSGSRCGCGARSMPARASALFHYSLLYLALLFVAAAIDPVVI